MIEVIPAIDIIDGKCVRLTKGEFRSATIYGDNPAAIAQQFEQMGFRRLHVVDLDGARNGRVVNTEALRNILSSTHMTVDFGGGIKSDDDIHRLADMGVHMVTIGSVAYKSPETMLRWMQLLGCDRIILAADARNGMLSTDGWTSQSEQPLLPFIARYAAEGITNVLCTDISRDGTMLGPATAFYREIMDAHPSLHLIASGGVASDDDIDSLNDARIPAVVVGKAFYEGKIIKWNAKMSNSLTPNDCKTNNSMP